MADGDERDLLSTPLFSRDAPDPGVAHREAEAAATRSEPHKVSDREPDEDALPDLYEPDLYEPDRHEPDRHEPDRHEPDRHEPDQRREWDEGPDPVPEADPHLSIALSVDVQPPEGRSNGHRSAPSQHAADKSRPVSGPPRTPAGGSIARVEVQPSQVVAAAGTAIVAGARMGRLFGRAGLRLAKQLPGVQTLEREAQRVQSAAAREVRRMLEIPPTAATEHPVASAEEQRAAALIRESNGAQAPLRSAMNELLERSVTGSRNSSRDYLFGTIISQLVPDEARILAALAGGTPYAAGDLVARGRGRGRERTLVANASTVGRSVGVGTPDNVPTYLTRLQAFGLIEFGPEDGSLDTQYDILGAEDVVRRARDSAERSRQGAVRFVRKTVTISALGRDFWAASDPSRTR